MNNKVVYILNQAFLANGFATLRFNFRGVGRSQGIYDEGIGELSDATSALQWLQSVHRGAPAIWTAGFSFGSWISMQLLMRRPEISGFVSVSPPANKYDFDFLAPCPCGGLVVQGTKDDIVGEPAVAELVKTLRRQRGQEAIVYDTIKEANHFFHGHEEKLKQAMTDYIGHVMGYRQHDVAVA